MNRLTPAGIFVSAVLLLGIASAQAGPCTPAIADFETTVRQSAKYPDAGPLGPQTIAAQLGHQPTPESVRRAEERAQTRFDAALAKAKVLDAQGDSACIRTLGDAKSLFNTE